MSLANSYYSLLYHELTDLIQITFPLFEIPSVSYVIYFNFVLLQEAQQYTDSRNDFRHALVRHVKLFIRIPCIRLQYIVPVTNKPIQTCQRIQQTLKDKE